LFSSPNTLEDVELLPMHIQPSALPLSVVGFTYLANIE
jgi:hypothetical protein